MLEIGKAYIKRMDGSKTWVPSPSDWIKGLTPINSIPIKG
jgi:hypothetical protein